MVGRGLKVKNDFDIDEQPVFTLLTACLLFPFTTGTLVKG